MGILRKPKRILYALVGGIGLFALGTQFQKYLNSNIDEVTTNLKKDPEPNAETGGTQPPSATDERLAYSPSTAEQPTPPVVAESTPSPAPMETKQIDWGQKWEAERAESERKFFDFCKRLKSQTGIRDFEQKVENEVIDTEIHMTFRISKTKTKNPYKIEIKEKPKTDILKKFVEKSKAEGNKVSAQIAIKFLGYQAINQKIQNILNSKKDEILKYLKEDSERIAQAEPTPAQIAEVHSESTPTPSSAPEPTPQHITKPGPTPPTEATPEPTPAPVAETMPSRPETRDNESQYMTTEWHLDQTLTTCPLSWLEAWSRHNTVATLVVVCEDGEKTEDCKFAKKGEEEPIVFILSDKIKVTPYEVNSDNYQTVCAQTPKGKTAVYRLNIRRK